MTTATETAGIEHLDFTYVQPCTHRRHRQLHEDQPARFLVRGHCPGCKREGLAFVCASGWELAGRGGVKCSQCRRIYPRDDTMTVTRVIGGAI